MPSKAKKRCLECGAPVRLDRIEDHYRKVHPKVDRRGLLSEQERTDMEKESAPIRKRTRINRKSIAILALLGIMTIALLMLVIFYPSSLQDRNPAPDFALKDTDGGTVRLSDYKGKVIFLSAIDPKGSPCQIETQNVIKLLFDRYGSRVVFLTIDVQLLGADTLASLKDFRIQIGAGWKFLLDDGSMRGNYGIDSTPRAIIISARGTILYHHTGMSQSSELSTQLDKALG